MFNAGYSTRVILSLFSDSALECGQGCDFYGRDPSLPVYKWTKPHQHFSVEELAKLLITNLVPKEKVCSKQPVRVCRKVPWSSDKKARLVMSSSSDHPHLVKTKGRNSLQYSCDEKCAMFKGFSLCSHVIAACHDNGDLHSFLENYTKSKCGPNLAAIANRGMPSGSGRKGGVPKRKRSRVTTPIQTRSVYQCLQQNSSPAPSSATLDRQQPNITAGFEQGTQKLLSNTSPNPTPVTETVKQPFNHLTSISGSHLMVVLWLVEVFISPLANLLVILDLLLHCLPTL